MHCNFRLCRSFMARLLSLLHSFPSFSFHLPFFLLSRGISKQELWLSVGRDWERERGIGILGILIGENLSIAQFMSTPRAEYPNGRGGGEWHPLSPFISSAEEWVLICTNLSPVARGIQNAWFTQPIASTITQLCISFLVLSDGFCNEYQSAEHTTACVAMQPAHSVHWL